ncbi:hypothetical protein GDO81_005698 [Engystomops pustulosus]|uniref:RING-type E3 ubiquitin transferase n=1 Tax=Engystomops pustulosus TaxID=76066 RepID=A0AAV7CQY9_ENGPU|nr:hypothetical protein GDO81_005698 [Engystomops pustulosus]
MWAACCNWLCVDTEPEELTQSARTHDRPNQNIQTSPPVSETTCRACGTRLQATSRKNPCMDCRNNFCATCLTRLNDGLPLCQLCRRIRSTAFTREELLKLKIKDLRDYLSMRDIPTDLCREKEDLVQLVLTLRPNSFPDVTNVPSFSSNQNSQMTGSSQIHTEQNIPTSTDSEEILVPGRRASLSDISNLDDIETLSVRQLKEILARNFVNYKGCCEKWELMERVTRLYHDQKDLHQKVTMGEEEGKFGAAGDENLCKVCMDSPIDCVLLECGHMVTCTKCGKRMSECPICRHTRCNMLIMFRIVKPWVVLYNYLTPSL